MYYPMTRFDLCWTVLLGVMVSLKQWVSQRERVFHRYVMVPLAFSNLNLLDLMLSTVPALLWHMSATNLSRLPN